MKESTYLIYNNTQDAIEDITKKFPIPKDHSKNKNCPLEKTEMQKYLEFSVLLKFIKFECINITFPLKIEHIGENEGYPDFVIEYNNQKYIVEVTSATDQESNIIYNNKNSTKLFDAYQAPTNLIQERINDKNSKLEVYKKNTNIEKSILLIDNQHVKLFTIDKICDNYNFYSNFDKGFIFIPIEDSLSEEYKDYIEIQPNPL